LFILYLDYIMQEKNQFDLASNWDKVLASFVGFLIPILWLSLLKDEWANKLKDTDKEFVKSYIK